MIYPRPLEVRCEIHATKMYGEGWYTTGHVLALAVAEIRKLNAELAAVKAEPRLRSAERQDQ